MEKEPKEGHVDDLPQEVFSRPKVIEKDWGLTSSLVLFGTVVAGAWLLLSEDFLSGLFTGTGFALYLLVFMWFLFFAKLMSGDKAKSSLYMSVIHSRAEEVTLRKRPGCAIFLQLKISHPLAGRKMELLVEFKDENGHLHKSSLRAYRGDFDEVLVRKEVQLPKVGSKSYPYVEAGVFVPLRAFTLRENQRDLRMQPVVTYKVEWHILEKTVLPYEVFDTRTIAALQSETASDGDLVISTVEIGEKGEELVCQICGYPMTEDLVTCSTCDTPHHKECWEYIGGCSTYGCEGRPANSEND